MVGEIVGTLIERVIGLMSSIVGKRDNHSYDRVTSMLTCRLNTRGHGQHPGCGMKFLIGMVAWPLTTSPARARPCDQRPNPR